ncbi:response regulator transcription factor [Flavobacterium amniphilum]|uniref:response regulator transcription factor n=1 Tax=Flavobacterium amniphilum TaxID=1834035 RepID=UPI00202A8AD5|nr:response regulator transcription factor [Flavobacterium amniphilum]MCL9806632.1 response regulator transcription factor [Flavobacterium amniphilum]
MTIKRKQTLLMATAIFLAFTSVVFIFNGTQTMWLWQRHPYFAILLLLGALFCFKKWVAFEIEKQKEAIKQDYFKTQSGTETGEQVSKMLSEREKEVLNLIVKGLSNNEIANQLFISLSTVKTHINNIYKLLEVKNRREAIEKAISKE